MRPLLARDSVFFSMCGVLRGYTLRNFADVRMSGLHSMGSSAMSIVVLVVNKKQNHRK